MFDGVRGECCSVIPAKYQIKLRSGMLLQTDAAVKWKVGVGGVGSRRRCKLKDTLLKHYESEQRSLLRSSYSVASLTALGLQIANIRIWNSNFPYQDHLPNSSIEAKCSGEISILACWAVFTTGLSPQEYITKF